MHSSYFGWLKTYTFRSSPSRYELKLIKSSTIPDLTLYTKISLKLISPISSSDEIQKKSLLGSHQWPYHIQYCLFTRHILQSFFSKFQLHYSYCFVVELLTQQIYLNFYENVPLNYPSIEIFYFTEICSGKHKHWLQRSYQQIAGH